MSVSGKGKRHCHAQKTLGSGLHSFDMAQVLRAHLFVEPKIKTPCLLHVRNFGFCSALLQIVESTEV